MGPTPKSTAEAYSNFAVPIRVFAHPTSDPLSASAISFSPNPGLEFETEIHMSIKRNLLAAVTVLALTAPAAAADIVETAASNGSFTTLVAAVRAAGLV